MLNGTTHHMICSRLFHFQTPVSHDIPPRLLNVTLIQDCTGHMILSTFAGVVQPTRNNRLPVGDTKQTMNRLWIVSWLSSFPTMNVVLSFQEPREARFLIRWSNMLKFIYFSIPCRCAESDRQIHRETLANCWEANSSTLYLRVLRG